MELHLFGRMVMGVLSFTRNVHHPNVDQFATANGCAWKYLDTETLGSFTVDFLVLVFQIYRSDCSEIWRDLNISQPWLMLIRGSRRDITKTFQVKTVQAHH